MAAHGTRRETGDRRPSRGGEETAVHQRESQYREYRTIAAYNKLDAAFEFGVGLAHELRLPGLPRGVIPNRADDAWRQSSAVNLHSLRR